MIEVDSAFRKPLELALHGALQYLESLDSAPVAASANAQTLRSRMNKPLQSSGIRADCVVEELLADVSDGITGSGGSRRRRSRGRVAQTASWSAGDGEFRLCHRLPNGARNVFGGGPPRAARADRLRR